MDPSSTKNSINVDAGSPLWVVVFSPNGDCIISGHDEEVRAWRVESGEQMKMATMRVRDAHCLAMSRDNKWMATATSPDGFSVWDVNTYEQVWAYKQGGHAIAGIDFSPDSTRLVSASRNGTATVWDIAKYKQVQTLRHEQGHELVAAKYAPYGFRIATATRDSVRVWDSKHGFLLVDIPVTVTPRQNTGLLWLDNYLVVVSNNTIKQFDAFNGEAVADWPVPGSDYFSCIALPNRGTSIAYSTKNTVTSWDTSTHTQLWRIQYPDDIRSIAFSPCGLFLAVGRKDGKISIKSLSLITNPIPMSCPHPTFQEPSFKVDDATLDSWRHCQFTNAEASLTAVIRERNRNYHALASRALVRARLQKWDAALVDADTAIDIRPSAIGFIAKSVAHVGKRERHEGYRACDAACELDPSHVNFLLLIKAIIMFMSGEHRDAISRIDDLIATVHSNSMCYAVKAYMYLLLGNSDMECRDYNGALRSFGRARVQMRGYAGPPPLAVSLISGWKFHNLGITIRQHICEALYAAGRLRDSGESLLEMVKDFRKEIYMSEPTTRWVSGFIQQCLLIRKDDIATWNAPQQGDPSTIHTVSIPLLRVWAKATLADAGWKDAMDAATEFTVTRATIYWVVCERLELMDHIADAVECFQEMVDELGGELRVGGPITKWVCNFTQRCLSTPESHGDTASMAMRHWKAKASITLLREWTKVSLMSRSWRDTLTAATNFVVPRFTIYQVVCERLEAIDLIMEACECFLKLVNELTEEANVHHDKVTWILDFERRSLGKLENLGDTAMNAGRHHDAIFHYSAALALDPPAAGGLFCKRGKAHIATGAWEDAFNDANKVIELDPLSVSGHEIKRAALCRTDYNDVINALEETRSTMSQTPVPDDLMRQGHINPEKAKQAIRKTVQNAIRNSPRVLINTISGRLLDKSEQAAAFESLPLFDELISMTTHIDQVRIEHDVTQYYRYAMFSHRWENNEPLFEKVVRTVVYDLEDSLSHNKLKMFCKTARELGLHWAWSDTCCINKADHFVLQEALVAMFKWYRGSAVTLILLCDVRSPSRRGDLVRSIWNTRAWTFQEYHASKVVRFYNEDWTLYLNLDILNHKDSPEILSEMEESTGVSAQALMALRPGLDDIRKKLCLASRRQATHVEDAAYALLGIFSMAMPVVYGEGDQALGRLLAQLLTSSGDTSILAWTGRSGSFNSCLPGKIAVFKDLPETHVPLVIQNANMAKSSLNLVSVAKLFDRLLELPVPSFSGQRMKLPCLAFTLGRVSATWSKSGGVFRAKTSVFGSVEITARDDLTRLKTLILVHPWIDFLLDRQPVGSANETMSLAAPQSHTTRSRLASRFKALFGARPRDVASLSLTDRQTLVLQLAARLRQPFGALLFTPTRQNVAEYRRVASESRIIVRMKDDVPPNVLMASARVLDVL